MTSMQKKIEKNKAPRVHITYDVETNGAMEQKELPMVVGVLGDFTGNNPGKKPDILRERHFVELQEGGVDQLMRTMEPGLKFKVEDKLNDTGDLVDVDLKFKSIQDFGPEQIAKSIPALKALLDKRELLKELLNKSGISDELNDQIKMLLKNPDQQKKLAKELNIDLESEN